MIARKAAVKRRPKIALCPWCGMCGAWVSDTYRGFAVTCGFARCGAWGPERKTSRAAITAWTRAPEARGK
jgi:hypothetical protein